MKNQKALIQRKNDILGKGIHYNICENGYGISSIGIREAGRYRFALIETKKGKNKILTSILSTPLSYDLKNFILLKHLYHNFGKDISFKDFYGGTKKGLEHTFKEKNLESKLNISTEDPEDLKEPERGKCAFASGGVYMGGISLLLKCFVDPPFLVFGLLGVFAGIFEYGYGIGGCNDNNSKFLGLSYLFHKSGIFRENLHRKISKLGQKIVQSYNEKGKAIHNINELNQHMQEVREKLDSGTGFKEKRQLEDNFKTGLKNTMALGENISSLSNRQKSLTGKIQKTEEELNKYFDFIHRRKGIHITAESKRENAYEIIANFYRQLLNPEKEDFDIEEARKEIEEGWKEVKQLS